MPDSRMNLWLQRLSLATMLALALVFLGIGVGLGVGLVGRAQAPEVPVVSPPPTALSGK